MFRRLSKKHIELLRSLNEKEWSYISKFKDSMTKLLELEKYEFIEIRGREKYDFVLSGQVRITPEGKNYLKQVELDDYENDYLDDEEEEVEKIRIRKSRFRAEKRVKTPQRRQSIKRSGHWDHDSDRDDYREEDYKEEDYREDDAYDYEVHGEDDWVKHNTHHEEIRDQHHVLWDENNQHHSGSDVDEDTTHVSDEEENENFEDWDEEVHDWDDVEDEDYDWDEEDEESYGWEGVDEYDSDDEYDEEWDDEESWDDGADEVEWDHD
ncbi:MAG: hypothetical protein ACFFCZ_28015 [Promethearchaeota archaeon]